MVDGGTLERSVLKAKWYEEFIPDGSISSFIAYTSDHISPTVPSLPFPSPSVSYEKLTNFGSLGLPSGPMPFFAKRPSVYILLASSKPTLRFLIIFWISFLLEPSKPARLSPSATLPLRSKADEESPASMSPAKVEGSLE